MSQDTKICPYCHEEIHKDAIKCKHCNSMLAIPLSSAPKPRQQVPQPAHTKKKRYPALTYFVIFSIIVAIIIAILLLLPTEKGLAKSPWPMFRGNLRHTSQSKYNGPKRARKKWEFGTGYWVLSSPAIGADGTIYFGSRDNKLYAVKPDGEKLWEFVTGGSVNSSPAIGADGTIHFGSRDNKLYAVKPNGEKLWEFGAGYYVHSSPAIGADGTIYFGSFDKLCAVKPNGEKLWEFGARSWVSSSPAIGADGTIYFGSRANKLYAIGE